MGRELMRRSPSQTGDQLGAIRSLLAQNPHASWQNFSLLACPSLILRTVHGTDPLTMLSPLSAMRVVIVSVAQCSKFGRIRYRREVCKGCVDDLPSFCRILGCRSMMIPPNRQCHSDIFIERCCFNDCATRPHRVSTERILVVSTRDLQSQHDSVSLPCTITTSLLSLASVPQRPSPPTHGPRTKRASQPLNSKSYKARLSSANTAT